MGKLIGGAILLLMSLFMLLGFFTADKDMSVGARGMSFLVLVVIPALGGSALLLAHFRARRSLSRGRESLRRQTEEAEVLRLAKRRDGRLTVIEVVAETGMDAAKAQDTLTSLVTQGLGDLDLDEPGAIVYEFPDIVGRNSREHDNGA